MHFAHALDAAKPGCLMATAVVPNTNSELPVLTLNSKSGDAARPEESAPIRRVVLAEVMPSILIQTTSSLKSVPDPTSAAYSAWKRDRPDSQGTKTWKKGIPRRGCPFDQNNEKEDRVAGRGTGHVK